MASSIPRFGTLAESGSSHFGPTWSSIFAKADCGASNGKVAQPRALHSKFANRLLAFSTLTRSSSRLRGEDIAPDGNLCWGFRSWRAKSDGWTVCMGSRFSPALLLC